MSAPHPEPNTSPPSEPKQKLPTDPFYVYAVSWKWLVGGLIAILGFGGIIGALYLVQTSNRSGKIIDVVQGMMDDAEREKTAMEQTDDPEKRAELLLHSLRIREEAANWLNDYRRAHPATTETVVLEKLYEILESLYKDYGESSTARGIERGTQLSSLAVELAMIVPADASVKYRKRLLELAWDRRVFADIIRRGVDLLKTSIDNTPSVDAMRYIAMAFFDRLPVQPYNPTDPVYGLPPGVFPEAMDELLGRLNALHPEDIEIARRYAEFIVSVERENFSACASSPLLERSPPERFRLAKSRMDEMVQCNRDNPAAFLARYHFVSQFMPTSIERDEIDSDLKTVLDLAPRHPEGLILASLDALRQAGMAAAAKDEARVTRWYNQAEEFLRRTIKDNPNDPFGYQYLGDYLLFMKKNATAAVEIWNQGLKNSHHRGDEELIGRVVMVLLDQRRVDEVREKLEHLSRTIAEMRFSRSPMDVRRTGNMEILLTAQLYYAEAKMAASKIEAAQRANDRKEVLRLSGIVQQKQRDAIEKFDSLLRDFGRNQDDYIIEKRSVYELLLPQSLMQAGELNMTWGLWDSAVSYFDRASRFVTVRPQALLAKSSAYQRGGEWDRAAQALKEAAQLRPEDLPIRYAYAMTLFSAQLGSNNVDTAALDTVQQELEALDRRRNELPQPWVIEMRLIHLGVARANLSNSAEQILEALNEATRKFQALEKGTFPPDANGNVKKYMDDLAFVSEMVGIYSGLAARSDFDRMLQRLRELPEGEAAYFEARILDFGRRDDKEGAIATIEAAIDSPLLAPAIKDRLVALLPTLKGEGLDGVSRISKAYEQLKTTFDTAPETLNPEAFFLLAEMALDRGEVEKAKQVQGRLENIEGASGTRWRYIAVRIMLREKDPDYAQMRRRQEEIVAERPTWDRAYVLQAMIEERFFAENPGSTEIPEQLMGIYRTAIRNGNTQPEIWQRLSGLLEAAGRTEEARDIVRQALLRGVPMEARTGQLPQPYGRMYADIQEALEAEDATGADTIARECITLAERTNERPELVFTLNLLLGKAFLDHNIFQSAIRHLSATAQRGGTYLYPLALSVAKSGDVDAGFSLLLDEIDHTPSEMPLLLPAVLVMLTQVQPSEEVFKRIDSLMLRIEEGRRLTLSTDLPDSDSGNTLKVGTRWVQSRKIQSMVVRFPDKTEQLDPSLIEFLSPEELGREPDTE